MSLVHYIKTLWKAGKSGGTPITPDNLNKIEDGIEAVTNEAININNNLANEISERKAEVDVERKRIDNIALLPEGSTTADAELIDIRVGADGTTYTTAGKAVRGQINELKNEIDTANEGVNKLNSDLAGISFSINLQDGGLDITIREEE